MNDKCLVTKLNGVVKDNSLPLLGYVSVKVSAVNSPTGYSQGFFINPEVQKEAIILGDGYFTNQQLTDNYGKKLAIAPDSVGRPFWVSNGNFYVNIPMNTTVFVLKQSNTQDGNGNALNKSLDISTLKFCTKISNLEISQTGAYGDIDAFSNMKSLTSFFVSGAKGLFGDIKSLANCPIKNFYAEFTNLGGDISNLSSCSILVCQGSTDFYGKLHNLPNIWHAYLGTNAITFDGSKLGSKAALITGNVKATWEGERDNSYNIIGFNGIQFGGYVDAMLINQAKCQVGDQKIISVVGTRTSASDSAVATLQSKGYTVSVFK